MDYRTAEYVISHSANLRLLEHFLIIILAFHTPNNISNTNVYLITAFSVVRSFYTILSWQETRPDNRKYSVFLAVALQPEGGLLLTHVLQATVHPLVCLQWTDGLHLQNLHRQAAGMHQIISLSISCWCTDMQGWCSLPWLHLS